MTAKLNQIIAIEKGAKTRIEAAINEVYHSIQKAEPIKGIGRSYKPKDDEGERLPAEFNRVQIRASEVIESAKAAFAELMDITATKDWANCKATADVVVDGKTLLGNAPVTYLLFLEKKLVDIRTFITKLPVLDASETWTFDDAQNCYATAPKETTKTKKVLKNHEKSPATDKHPAQVETFSEDVIVGYWSSIQYSGALPAKRVAELLARVEKLQAAVKFAREAANSIEAPETKVGAQILGYVFA